MAYVPKDWVLGDSITEADMDHIEQGIAAASSPLGAPLIIGSTSGTNVIIGSTDGSIQGRSAASAGLLLINPAGGTLNIGSLATPTVLNVNGVGVNAAQLSSTGWGGLGGTIAAGWTIASGFQYRAGNLVKLQLVGSYTSDIVSTATGALSGGAILVYTASDLAPAQSQYFASGSNVYPMLGGYIVASTGVVRISGLSVPNYTIPAGTQVMLDFTYLVNG